MPGWTLVDTHLAQGRTFRRPLGRTELFFFWNSLINGSGDALQYCELRLPNGSQDVHLFSNANIVKAWLSAKQCFPLAGAIVRGADRAPLRFKTATDSNADNGTGFALEPHIVVRERDLAALRPREVVFGSVASADEAQQRMNVILNGLRPLSEELLMQLCVFRKTDAQRTDVASGGDPPVLYLMLLGAHFVIDRVGITTFVRCLLDTLARGGGSEPAQIPLEDRLAMLLPLMDREPMYLRSLSQAERRWRRAAGMVIFQSRTAKRQVSLLFLVVESLQTIPHNHSDRSANGPMIILIGWAYYSVALHAFQITRPPEIWPGLHLADADSNYHCNCELSFTWHYIRKCLPSSCASGNDSGALSTIPARRDLRGGMGISKETTMCWCGSNQPASVSRQGVVPKGRWKRAYGVHWFILLPAPVHDTGRNDRQTPARSVGWCATIL